MNPEPLAIPTNSWPFRGRRGGGALRPRCPAAHAEVARRLIRNRHLNHGRGAGSARDGGRLHWQFLQPVRTTEFKHLAYTRLRGRQGPARKVECASPRRLACSGLPANAMIPFAPSFMSCFTPGWPLCLIAGSQPCSEMPAGRSITSVFNGYSGGGSRCLQNPDRAMEETLRTKRPRCTLRYRPPATETIVSMDPTPALH